jgi:uncharacterized protein YxjI
MHPLLKHNLFFIKEKVGLFKASNNYDIYDPNTRQLIMECREVKMGLLTRILRFSEIKRMTPFAIEVRSAQGEKIITVKRGVSILLSNVEVLDENDLLVGKFKQRFLSIGGRFDVEDADGKVVCSLKGNWTNWDFRFEGQQGELAHVSKKWAGLGKELFTTADNYMLSINASVGQQDFARQLILGAVLCIDMVIKE